MVTGKLHAALTDTTEDDVKRYKLRDLENAYREETERVRQKVQRDNWRKELLNKPKAKPADAVAEPDRHEDLFE
jgi:CRISPR/Cas system-associated protein Csm6